MPLLQTQIWSIVHRSRHLLRHQPSHLGVAYYPPPLTKEDKNLRKAAQKFVDNFYKCFNHSPKTIHSFYDEHCTLVWSLHSVEQTYEIKTAEGVKLFWSLPAEFKCQRHCFNVQKHADLTLIMVNGIWDGCRERSNFVECFLLSPSWQIIKDIVFVFIKGNPLLTPWRCATRASAPDHQLLIAAPKTENTNQMLRRSLRIIQKSTELASCKKVEVMRAESKKAAIRKRHDKEPIDSECRECVMVCILYDDIMLGHRPDFYCRGDIRMVQHDRRLYPKEKPERISCIIEKMTEENMFDRVTHVHHGPAELKDILAVHGDKYVHFIETLPQVPNDNTYVGFYSDEMYCSEGTRAAVFSAAGANIKACRMVIKDQFKKAFAIVRPPGHHVGTDEAEGFCYANNIAIGASYLLRNHDVKKILIVDWDAHHGNGTQKLFYGSNQVLFFNVYNMDLEYPVSSKMGPECVGKGEGAGFNFNVPLPSGFTDSDILYVWNELLIPLAKQFSPEITLISCGFDAAEGDLLGHAKLTPPCYATMLDKLDKVGNGKLVLTLEGGYNLKVLANCASHCVRAMYGDRTALRNRNTKLDPVNIKTLETVKYLKHYHSLFWEPFERGPED